MPELCQFVCVMYDKTPTTKGFFPTPGLYERNTWHSRKSFINHLPWSFFGVCGVWTNPETTQLQQQIQYYYLLKMTKPHINKTIYSKSHYYLHVWSGIMTAPILYMEKFQRAISIAPHVINGFQWVQDVFVMILLFVYIVCRRQNIYLHKL